MTTLPRRKVYKFLFIVLVFLIYFTSAQAQQKTIKIVSEIDWSDTVNEQDKKGSLVTQISTLVLEKMGYKVYVSFAPWARALRNVVNGDVDGIAGIFLTDERAELLAFTDSLVTTELLLYTRTDSDIVFNGDLNELSPYKIGIVRNYTYGESFDDARHLTKIVSVKSTSNIRMLLAKRVDVIVDTKKTINFLMNEEFPERVDEVVPLTTPIKKQEVYFAFSKSLPNHRYLTETFNQTLSDLRKDGSIEELESKFVSDY